MAHPTALCAPRKLYRPAVKAPMVEITNVGTTPGGTSVFCDGIFRRWPMVTRGTFLAEQAPCKPEIVPPFGVATLDQLTQVV